MVSVQPSTLSAALSTASLYLPPFPTFFPCPSPRRCPSPSRLAVLACPPAAVDREPSPRALLRLVPRAQSVRVSGVVQAPIISSPLGKTPRLNPRRALGPAPPPSTLQPPFAPIPVPFLSPSSPSPFAVRTHTAFTFSTQLTFFFFLGFLTVSSQTLHSTGTHTTTAAHTNMLQTSKR